MRGPSMDDWIHKMISTRAQAPSAACADENVMAAYLEGALSAQEKRTFESHVSGCAVCREVLALVMKMHEGEANAFAPEINESRFSPKTWFHFSYPVPVLGGIFVAIISVAGIFFLMRDSRENLHPAQSAQLHLPEPESKRLEPEIPKATSDRNTASPRFEKLPIAVPEESVETAEAPDRALKTETAPAAVPSNQMAAMQAETPAILGEEAHFPSEQEPFSDTSALRMKGRQVEERPPSIQADKAEETDIRDLEEPNKRLFRKVGDKEFFWDSGYWTDRQCLKHPGAPVVAITSTDYEYKSILEHYPDLLQLTPAKIFRDGRIYIFR